MVKTMVSCRFSLKPIQCMIFFRALKQLIWIRQGEREDSGGVQDAPGATTVRVSGEVFPTGRCVVRGAKQTIYNIPSGKLT